MDKEIQRAWSWIDSGLATLMERNDTLSDRELRAKSRRLRHLGRFVEVLAKRVDERLRGVKVGDIQPLFTKYKDDRAQIDAN